LISQKNRSHATKHKNLPRSSPRPCRGFYTLHSAQGNIHQHLSKFVAVTSATMCLFLNTHHPQKNMIFHKKFNQFNANLSFPAFPDKNPQLVSPPEPGHPDSTARRALSALSCETLASISSSQKEYCDYC